MAVPLIGFCAIVFSGVGVPMVRGATKACTSKTLGTANPMSSARVVPVLAVMGVQVPSVRAIGACLHDLDILSVRI